MTWSHDAFLPVLLLACLQYTRVFSPAWSLFHGWEHRKSSSDGRDPSSDWTGSGRREPSHSATSPDAPARDSERRPDPRTSCSCTASPEEPTVKYYNHVLKSTLVLRNIIPQLNYEAQWGYVCYLFEKISEKFALQRNDSIWLQKHANKGKKPRGLKISGLVTWLPRGLICHTFSLLWAAYTHAVRAPSLFAQAPTDKNTSKDKFMYLKAITNRTLWDLVLCPAWGIYRAYRGLHIPNHLFVQDADKEEPLARSHSHPSLARTDRIALLQSIEALEAFMSWTEKTKSVQQQSNTSPSCPAAVLCPSTRSPSWLWSQSLLNCQMDITEC